MGLLSPFARIARAEYRQEFVNHHCGSFRKRINAFRDLQGHRQRRSYARSLDLSKDCFGEAREIIENRCAPLLLDKRFVQPFLETCRERFDAVGESDEMCQEGKRYYLNILQDTDYDPSSPFMQFALDEKLLNTVSIYLGYAAYLQSIELIISRPVETEEPLTKSQLWHCDNNNDQRLLKLFLYVSDVTDVNGPLTFLPRAQSERIPWYAGHYISDNQMSQFVSLADKVKFKGVAGSAFIMDTASLYHFGSRCDEPRLTFVVHFNSGFGYLPRNNIHKKWANTDAHLSMIQRLAIGELG